MKKLIIPFLSLIVILLSSCSNSDTPDKPAEIDYPILSKIDYEFSPTGTIVSEETAAAISDVDTVDHSITLPLSTDVPKVGQTLVINTPSKELPDGLLAKVKSVNVTSNGYEITYEDAELKDAFKDINIPEQYIPIGQYVEHVYDAEGNEMEFKKVPKTRASGEKTFEIVLPEIGWPLAKGVELTPKMSIDLAMRYVFQFGDYELSYAGVNIDADITVGADLNATIKEGKLLEKKFHIMTIVCGAIPIGPVLLTPSIDVQGLVKIDGKITLEASISYSRTLHTSMKYQKGAGLSGTFEFEPESPDALQFKFGPKFEGGISYGLIMGGNIGVFGKTLAVRSRINLVKKETISGKLDLAAFTGTGMQGLETYILANTSPLLALLSSAERWKFAEFEDIMYNQSIGVQVGWDLTTLGLDVASTNLPEMSIPFSSVHICPQFEIKDKDFLVSTTDGEVTLKLHHTEQSILDDLTEFRAVFKRVGAKDNEEPIVAYFNFDDEKREWLKAEVKGADVTSTAKAKLNGGERYDIILYMNVANEDVVIFRGTAKKENGLRTDPSSISVNIKLGLKSENGYDASMIYDGLINARTLYWCNYGNNIQVKSTETAYGGMNVSGSQSIDYSDGDKLEASISFTCDGPRDNNFGAVHDVVIKYKYTYSWGEYTMWTLTATDIPNYKTESALTNPNSSYGFAQWHAEQDDNTLNITSLDYETFIKGSSEVDNRTIKYTVSPRENDYLWISCGYSKP